MTPSEPNRRRVLARLLAAGGALFLASCDRLSDTAWFPKLLESGEKPS